MTPSSLAQPTVLALGETMVLVSPVRAESLETAADFMLGLAGAESNVACHLALAGVPAAWAGAVGGGALGRRILDTLALRGVDVSLAVVDESAPSGLVVKDPDPGDRRVHYYRAGSAASRLGPDFAASLPLDTVPWVHISGITPALSPSCDALIVEIIERRHAAGLPVSFDVNYRAALWSVDVAGPRLLELASLCDLVFVGADESATLWAADSAAATRALLPDVPTLVVKDGADGAHVFERTRSLGEGMTGATAFAPSLAVDVIDSVGAGDAFAAGYLAAMLEGADPLARLERGHEFAGRVLVLLSDY